MKSINAEGQTFIAGMKWSQLSGESLKAEIAAYATENNCKYGVIRKVNNDGVIQIQLGMMNQNIKKAWSAAGVLAEIHPNIVLVDVVKDAYWVCAVFGGLVLPGGDIIITDGEDVSGKIDEIMNLVGEDTDILISVSEAAGRQLNISGNVSKSFSDLISGESKNFGAHNQVVSLKGIPKIAVLGGVFVILCGGLIYAMMPSSNSELPADDFTDLTEMTLPGNVKFSASEMSSGVMTTSASTEKILDAAKQEEIMWLAEDFSSNNGYELIRNFVNLYGSVPSYVSGWSKAGADYDYSQPQKINVTWKKETGTGLMLKTSLGSAGVDVGVSIDGKKGSSIYKLPKIDKTEVPDVLKKIRDTSYKRLELTNDLDMMAITWAATKHTDTERPIAIEGIKDKNIAQTRQLKTNITDFTISGSGLGNLMASAEVLQKAESFIMTRLVIQSEKQNWVIYGALYE